MEENGNVLGGSKISSKLIFDKKNLEERIKFATRKMECGRDRLTYLSTLISRTIGHSDYNVQHGLHHR